jgi:hypothetical protein
MTTANRGAPCGPKYRHLLQLIDAVAECGDPRLTETHILALLCLGKWTDLKTGTAHPGNRMLSKWTRRSERSVQRAIKELIEWNLIERVSKGDGGRGLASRYKILIDDPRFPSKNPAITVPGFQSPNPAIAVSPFRVPKPRQTAFETPTNDGENPDRAAAAHLLTLSSTPSSAPSAASQILSPEQTGAEIRKLRSQLNAIARDKRLDRHAEVERELRVGMGPEPRR